MSGILTEQAQSVADVYAPFIELDDIAIEGDWTRVSGTKKHKHCPTLFRAFT